MPISGWWVVVLAVTIVGALLVPVLVARGLRQLNDPRQPSAASLCGTSLAGAAAGAAVAEAAHRGGISWWWFAALLAWALTLVAAAVCDGLTQRVPTALLRSGGIVTGVLVLIAAVITRDWRGLLTTLTACAAAGAILAACWRFAGAGFGDVRLATFGGLGLGHSTQRSVVLAVFAFAVLTTAQAVWTYTRTRDRKAHFAYGPALAVGFLIAAAA